MTGVIAADLDGTLVVNSRTVQRQADLFTMDTYATSSSVMTKRAAVMVADLVAANRLLPVTTRTSAQYERMVWPGAGRPRAAVVANGAEIIVDGVKDLQWDAQVQDAMIACDWNPTRATSMLAALTSDQVRIRLADGWFAFAVLPSAAEIDLDAIAMLNVHAASLGWTVSVQGRKVYLIPDGVTKQAALGYLQDQHGFDVVCSVGDSLLDAGMLDLAPHAARPEFGELARLGWVTPGMYVVTGADPVKVAENVVLWATHQVTEHVSAERGSVSS